MKIARSTKTTVAGIAAGLGIFGYALSDILKDGWQLQDLGLVLAALGAGAMGFAARDDNVSSEGSKLPRVK